MRAFYPFFILFLLTMSTQAQGIDFIWAKHMSSSGLDYSTAIVSDNNGNVYTTGNFYSTATDFDPGPNTNNLATAGDADIFVQKLDSNGNLLWVHSFGGTVGNGGTDVGYAIALDELNNVYITGYYRGTVDFDPSQNTSNLTSAGQEDIFILKLNNNGAFAWVKSIGTINIERAIDLKVNKGYIYVTGYYSRQTDFNPGQGVFTLPNPLGISSYILKLDTLGDFVWAKAIGGANANSLVNTKAIAIDASKNVLITGNFIGTSEFDPSSNSQLLNAFGNSDIFVLSLDSAGSFNWVKQMGGTGNDYAADIDIDRYRNIVLTGSFEATADFDPSPSTQNLTAGNMADVFIQKLSPNGILIWVKQLAGIDEISASSIMVNQSAEIYAAGSFKDSINVNTGNNPYYLDAIGRIDNYLLKLDSAGTFNWAQQIGGHQSTVIPSSLAAGPLDVVFMTGTFRGTVDFDPTSGVQNYSSGTPFSSSNIFIQKLGNRSVGIKEYNSKLTYSVFPNPSKGQFTISLEEKVNQLKISIRDMSGKEITKSTHSNTSRIDLVINESAGIYFVELTTPNGSEIVKMVKR